MKCKSVTIYQYAESAELLDALSRVARIPKAAFVREGIDLVLAREKVLPVDRSTPGVVQLELWPDEPGDEEC